MILKRLLDGLGTIACLWSQFILWLKIFWKAGRFQSLILLAHSSDEYVLLIFGTKVNPPLPSHPPKKGRFDTYQSLLILQLYIILSVRDRGGLMMLDSWLKWQALTLITIAVLQWQEQESQKFLQSARIWQKLNSAHCLLVFHAVMLSDFLPYLYVVRLSTQEKSDDQIT